MCGLPAFYEGGKYYINCNSCYSLIVKDYVARVFEKCQEVEVEILISCDPLLMYWSCVECSPSYC